MNKKKAIIIGGGPAGLTAAYELLKNTDIQPVVIEMSEYWGGISRTVDYKGNKIDIGGHRFFSKSDVVMKWWSDILPIYTEQKDVVISYQNKSATIPTSHVVAEDNDKVMLIRNRKSRIYFRKTFFDYPISLTPSTIRKIGLYNTFLIGLSYIKSAVFPIRDEKTLDQFFKNRFGRRLYEMFFKDYTEKVWGIPCSEISAEWGAQRIKGLSITKTITHYIAGLFKNKKRDIQQKDVETSLIEYFLYPKYGPGQMWEEVAERIEASGGILMQNSRIVKIHCENSMVSGVTVSDHKGDEYFISGDYVVSSMPVTELIRSLTCTVPSNVSEVVDGLQYRDFITVGLLLKDIKYELEDNWIYVQEPYVQVGRIQVFNNWSPFLVHDPETVWLGLEYFCNTTDELWQMPDNQIADLAVEEMIKLGFIAAENDVLDFTVIKMPKTYPAYFGTYDRFAEIRNFTDQIQNLFLVGRNGMHKYNNQDHSMLTAMQAVRNINNGLTEKSNIWAINTEQEYHEQKK